MIKLINTNFCFISSLERDRVICTVCFTPSRRCKGIVSSAPFALLHLVAAKGSYHLHRLLYSISSLQRDRIICTVCCTPSLRCKGIVSSAPFALLQSIVEPKLEILSYVSQYYCFFEKEGLCTINTHFSSPETALG